MLYAIYLLLQSLRILNILRPAFSVFDELKHATRICGYHSGRFHPSCAASRPLLSPFPSNVRYVPCFSVFSHWSYALSWYLADDGGASHQEQTPTQLFGYQSFPIWVRVFIGVSRLRKCVTRSPLGLCNLAGVVEESHISLGLSKNSPQLETSQTNGCSIDTWLKYRQHSMIVDGNDVTVAHELDRGGVSS